MQTLWGQEFACGFELLPTFSLYHDTSRKMIFIRQTGIARQRGYFWPEATNLWSQAALGSSPFWRLGIKVYWYMWALDGKLCYMDLHEFSILTRCFPTSYSFFLSLESFKIELGENSFKVKNYPMIIRRAWRLPQVRRGTKRLYVQAQAWEEKREAPTERVVNMVLLIVHQRIPPHRSLDYGTQFPFIIQSSKEKIKGNLSTFYS